MCVWDRVRVSLRRIPTRQIEATATATARRRRGEIRRGHRRRMCLCASSLVLLCPFASLAVLSSARVCSSRQKICCGRITYPNATRCAVTTHARTQRESDRDTTTTRARPASPSPFVNDNVHKMKQIWRKIARCTGSSRRHRRGPTHPGGCGTYKCMCSCG